MVVRREWLSDYMSLEYKIKLIGSKLGPQQREDGIMRERERKKATAKL